MLVQMSKKKMEFIASKTLFFSLWRFRKKRKKNQNPGQGLSPIFFFFFFFCFQNSFSFFLFFMTVQGSQKIMRKKFDSINNKSVHIPDQCFQTFSVNWCFLYKSICNLKHFPPRVKRTNILAKIVQGGNLISETFTGHLGLLSALFGANDPSL